MADQLTTLTEKAENSEKRYLHICFGYNQKNGSTVARYHKKTYWLYRVKANILVDGG